MFTYEKCMKSNLINENHTARKRATALSKSHPGKDSNAWFNCSLIENSSTGITVWVFWKITSQLVHIFKRQTLCLSFKVILKCLFLYLSSGTVQIVGNNNCEFVNEKLCPYAPFNWDIHYLILCKMYMLPPAVMGFIPWDFTITNFQDWRLKIIIIDMLSSNPLI